MTHSQAQALDALLLAAVPDDGSAIGNLALKQAFDASAAAQGVEVTAADFEQTRQALLAAGHLVRGKGRGGAVRRAMAQIGDFDLSQAQPPQTSPPPPPPRHPGSPGARRRRPDRPSPGRRRS